MSTNTFLETYKKAERLLQFGEPFLLSYSGGKDSLVILDILSKVTKEKIDCLFMYLVPELEVSELYLKTAKENYNVNIRQIMHWGALQSLQTGLYCFPQNKIKTITYNDILRIELNENGYKYIFNGSKKADSVHKRRVMAKNKINGLVHLIEDWNKYDVIAYLKKNNISIPEQDIATKGINSSGIGLTHSSLRFIYKNYPNDFLKIKNYFPFIDASIKREEYYGI